MPAAGRPKDESILLRLIAEGRNTGNITLLHELKENHGWDEEKYWRVRDELLSRGVLERGRGKGGSVRLRLDESSESQPVAEQARKFPENQLYDALLEVLRTEWVREMKIEPDRIHFELTAHMGKKQMGGRWSRPDISAVDICNFSHLPNKFLDIWTFEVCPAWGPTAVPSKPKLISIWPTTPGRIGPFGGRLVIITIVSFRTEVKTHALALFRVQGLYRQGRRGTDRQA
jgi:hypothetical protein